MAGKERTEAEMGSNLRGDYYFPTARKRYLPRIRKADEALDEVGACVLPPWLTRFVAELSVTAARLESLHTSSVDSPRSARGPAANPPGLTRPAGHRQPQRPRP